MHWIVVAVTGTSFDLNAFLYFHGVKFLLNGHKWDSHIVILTYITGPLFALTAGLFAMALFSRLKYVKSLINLFLLWLFIVGVSLFLAQGIIVSIGITEHDSPFYIDWAPVLAWMGIPPVIVYALNIPFAIMLLYVGANSARPFLLFAYTSTKINKLERRRKYFTEVAIMPFIVGALIVLAVSFPTGGTAFAENIMVHGIYLLVIAVILGVAWVALQYLNLQRDDLLKYKCLQQLDVFALFTLIILAVVIKVTWGGIYI